MAKYDTPKKACRVALEAIARAAQDESTELKFVNFGLTELPSEIGQLAQLTLLDLSSNQLTSLPSEIGQLTQLTLLYLSSNRLTSLPSEIGQLTQLTLLYLSSNRLTSLPSEIGQLTQLTELYMMNNQLTSLPPEIGELTQLTLLDLDGVGLTSLPPEIGELTQLIDLDLRNNELATLPLEIGQLTQLTELYMMNNQLTSLPIEIGQLTLLENLALVKNQLPIPEKVLGRTNDPQSILGFYFLYHLPQYTRSISWISKLQLNSSDLEKIPPEIDHLTNLEYLDLRGNDALPIPPEILAKIHDPQAILNYYFETVADAQTINEAKLVLVGEGVVGKTSLVNRLVHDTFNPDENKTEGIKITNWPVAQGEQEIDVHIWDFGGQEIMHATHQFFLTERTLYLLVVNARQSEAQNNLYYWLKVIESFGGDSPIIIVANKADEHPLDWNLDQLLAKYSQIQAVVETSCKTQQGIDRLRELIQLEVVELEHVNTQMPRAWFNVKEQLEAQADEQDYVPFADYVQLCVDEVVTDEADQATLIRFLHDLGVVLNFQDDRYTGLRDTHILNPAWVTEGVYRIINARDLLKSEGVLTWPALRKILKKPRYPHDRERRYILDMMRKFELCVSFRHGKDEKYLIPDLLPKKEPDTGDWDDALVFEYHYPEVLPSSLISRFIVRMEAIIHEQTYWRSGVLLAHRRNKALVRADSEAGFIHIAVQGQHNTRREFMAVIRHQIDTINQSIARLEAKCMVPHPDEDVVLIDYEYLLENEAQNIAEIIPPGAKSKVNVKAVLNGYEIEQERIERKIEDRLEKFERKLDAHRPKPEKPEEKEVFVSYAWGGESEGMVDAICEAFEGKGYVVTRDKSHMTYRDSIHEFMQRIGRGKSIIAVVSDKYMKSEYCMYEAFQMFHTPNLRERIFPMVLPEVNIFDFDAQADYLLYWAEEYKRLKAKYDQVNEIDPALAAPLTERLRDIKATSLYINDFMAQVADMNVWTAEMHEDEGFETLVMAIVARVEGE